MLKDFDHHSQYEDQINKFWQDNNCFVTKKNYHQNYTILMPPPNVTSSLHMGHGTGYTFQDWLIRHYRMHKKNSCWIPGLDHAGIATQMMVEKDLAKQNISKHQIGRDNFIKKAKQWKELHGTKILEQMKRMGFSCDWTKLAYTLDQQRSYAVRYAFTRLFNEGLIYRGHRLVNWDPQLETALGNDEVENKTINGFIYQIHYPQPDGSQGITIATTRPETMFGDMAIAVHPKDNRYKHLIGKNLLIPQSNREIPVIADHYVKSDFGTGALKITPAHDFNDFDIGKRHKLKNLIIFDDKARLNEHGLHYQGLDRFQCRKKLICDLTNLGYFKEKINYSYTAPHSERSGVLIEPKLCHQWFVSMKDLVTPAIDAAKNNDIVFYPDHWKKTWLYWLENIEDWCISRQLWWGHRIPVFTCTKCNHQFATTDLNPSSCPKCNNTEFTQDPDVLDTWFSSWLWPLSTCDWPQTQDNLKQFYPSKVIVSGADIIFHWVARMTLAGFYFHQKLPFKHVFFNAMVCDKKGRKFSKTLGNGIDPIEVIEKYGADSLRYTSAHLSPLGGRIKMSIDDFQIGRNFVNKLKNAGRFLFAYLQKHQSCEIKALDQCKLSIWHKGLIEKLHQTCKKIDDSLQAYKTHQACKLMYNYIWNIYCDWAIESTKLDFTNNSDAYKNHLIANISVMVYCFEGCLRMSHPLIPFITEKLFQLCPVHPDLTRKKALALCTYPSLLDHPDYDRYSQLWDTTHKIVQSIRRLKQLLIDAKEQNSPQLSFSKCVISFGEQFGENLYYTNLDTLEVKRYIDENNLMIKHLAKLDQVDCLISKDHHSDLDQRLEKTLDNSDCSLVIDILDHGIIIMLISTDKIKQSKLIDLLQKELTVLNKNLDNCEKKLATKAFISSAPKELVGNTYDYFNKLKLRKKSLMFSLNHFQ